MYEREKKKRCRKERVLREGKGEARSRGVVGAFEGYDVTDVTDLTDYQEPWEAGHGGRALFQGRGRGHGQRQTGPIDLWVQPRPGQFPDGMDGIPPFHNFTMCVRYVVQLGYGTDLRAALLDERTKLESTKEGKVLFFGIVKYDIDVIASSSGIHQSFLHASSSCSLCQ